MWVLLPQALETGTYCLAGTNVTAANRSRWHAAAASLPPLTFELSRSV